MNGLNQSEAQKLSNDEVDQAALDAEYAKHQQNQQVAEDSADIAVNEDHSTAETEEPEIDIDQLLSEEDNDDQAEEDSANKASEDENAETKADDDLFKVDDLSPEDTDDESLRVQFTPEQQKVIDKIIAKKVQKTKGVEAELEQIKRQINQLSGVPQPGQNGQSAVNPHVADLSQIPLPELSKPWEQMNALEQFNYLDSVKKTQEAAQQKAQFEAQQKASYQADLNKVLGAVQARIDTDEDLRKLWYEPNNFTPDMLVAVSDSPNAAQIVKYLHKTKNAELASLKLKPRDHQIMKVAEWKAEFNYEVKRRHQEAAAKPKPQPAGKIKSTIPTKSAPVKSRVYDPKNLERMSNEQLNKLKEWEIKNMR
jgi:hypothetical protein